MTCHHCRLSDDLVDEPDQIVSVDIKVVEILVVRRFTVSVYVDRVNMPVLAQLGHNKGVVLPDAHLTVNQQQRGLVVVHFPVVDHPAVRKRRLFLGRADRLQRALVLIIPVNIAVPIDAERGSCNNDDGKHN